MLKRPLYMNRIKPFMNTELIKVMTGMRRSGKSVMLELIQTELLVSGISEKQIISYNFEQMKYAHLLDAPSLYQDVHQKCHNIHERVYLFFDEIQEVKDWQKAINSFRVDFDCDIYITGSNAKLLSGELSTYLAGRYVQFEIFPFSFSEFMEIYKEKYPNASNDEIFQKYLVIGGMPYNSNLNFDEEVVKVYLEDLFNSVQLKDIIARNKIRDIDLLKKIITYVMLNIGNTFSASSISKFIKSEGRSISSETILNYLQYTNDSFLFYKARREDLKTKEVLTTNEKYYVCDQGIRQAVVGGNLKDINLTLENIIFMEAKRRGYQISIGRNGTKEIDFVLRKGEDKIYLQACYLLASEETVQREFGAYKGIEDNYPKYVLSLDNINFSQNGIKHYNIKDFLLLNEWR